MALQKIAFSDLPGFRDFMQESLLIFPKETTDMDNPEVQKAVLDRAVRWLEMQKDLGDVVKWGTPNIRQVGCITFVDCDVYVEREETESKTGMPFVSKQANGKVCAVCKEPASYKIGEVPGEDDPEPGRRRAVGYICDLHYYMMFRPKLSPDKEGELLLKGLLNSIIRTRK